MADSWMFLLAYLAVIIAGPVLNQRRRRNHARRLAELQSGAAERFMEERRSLEAYPPRSKRAEWVLFGLMLALWLVLVAIKLGDPGS
ncbi:hypothetical protein [Novosphingobium sp.]|uniref:hypothetical protein n=1 Tax=Novosphingobium sp. TaxID=1874826 RepID=UPI0027357E3A|nr:hypothetical protein [Novosphingobium sp.]MDP3908388.1 hypothetical protein [Novosphingobium sp.]